MVSSHHGAGRRFADSIAVGTTYELGSYFVTEPDIIEFASRWDPQDFHVDPVVAAEGHFGGIIASGVHTLAIFQRLAVETVYQEWAVIGGRRLSQIEFLNPVRGDMRLVGTLRIQDIEPESDIRSLVTAVGMLATADETVFRIVVEIYVARRGSAAN